MPPVRHSTLKEAAILVKYPSLHLHRRNIDRGVGQVLIFCRFTAQ